MIGAKDIIDALMQDGFKGKNFTQKDEDHFNNDFQQEDFDITVVSWKPEYVTFLVENEIGSERISVKKTGDYWRLDNRL